MAERFTEWLQNYLSLSPGLQTKLLESLAVIVVLWALRRIVLRIRSRRHDDPHVLYRWRKGSAYIAFAVGTLLVSRMWFEGIQTLSTFLGLLSAGVAIALRDPIVNLAGWAFILWRRPFAVGDRIQIGACAGDVIDPVKGGRYAGIYTDRSG